MADFSRENAALDRLLRHALQQSGAPRPAADGSPLQILDLACGPCREAGTLIRALQELRQGEGKPGAVRFVGADIRAREIGEARARTAADSLTNTTAEFLTTDCSTIGEHKELGRDFDLTFLRHQNFWNDAPVWRRIFAAGLEKLKDDGLLVITSYFDREHALAIRALEDAGAELIVTAANPDTIELATPGKSTDRHLAVFRRKR